MSFLINDVSTAQHDIGLLLILHLICNNVHYIHKQDLNNSSRRMGKVLLRMQSERRQMYG